MAKSFPAQEPGLIYLTEGGQETEIMYKHGHDLPHFAMFTLLDDPAATEQMRAMYRAYLDIAADHGCAALIGGLDYRASPDWGALLGYSAEALADMQLRAIDFLREVARPYESHLPHILISGVAGPRGDAYELNLDLGAEAAEEYHSVQMATLARAGVDLVSAMTFNAVPEAIGAARAAAGVGLPLAQYFTLHGERLGSGPSLDEAIAAVDAATGDARPAFYGINCSHPLEFGPALGGGTMARIRALRPNAVSMEKIELCQLGHLESGDPPDLGRRMGALAAEWPHIDIWGGCCGTWDAHLAEIADNVLRVRADA